MTLLNRIFLILLLSMLLTGCIQTGQQITHYPSGKLKSEVTTLNATDYKYSEYYENGNLKKSAIFIQRNGSISYSGFEYYENGTIGVLINGKDGKLNGEGVSYYPSGKIFEKKNYKDDVLDGLDELYTESGNVIIESNYVVGVKQGLEEIYFDNGKIRMTRYYEKGVPYKVTTYYENGKKCLEAEFKPGSDGLIKAAENTEIKNFRVYDSEGKLIPTENQNRAEIIKSNLTKLDEDMQEQAQRSPQFQF